MELKWNSKWVSTSWTSTTEILCEEVNNNNNDKLYLHDYNKVLQYCKSYLNLIIESLFLIKYLN